jgi:hypothetical protein
LFSKRCGKKIVDNKIATRNRVDVGVKPELFLGSNLNFISKKKSLVAVCFFSLWSGKNKPFKKNY